MFLFLGLYLQVVLGYSPIMAGFAFLPFSVGIIVGAGIASQLLPRVGPKPLMVPGLLGGCGRPALPLDCSSPTRTTGRTSCRRCS